MNRISNGVANLQEMFTCYLTKLGDMFPGREMAGRQKMLNDLREIGKLYSGEECLRESNARLGG